MENANNQTKWASKQYLHCHHNMYNNTSKRIGIKLLHKFSHSESMQCYILEQVNRNNYYA